MLSKKCIAVIGPKPPLKRVRNEACPLPLRKLHYQQENKHPFLCCALNATNGQISRENHGN
jgi:hypothetical protein